jgi:cell division protein FtsI/penicillin-binding protein 2
VESPIDGNNIILTLDRDIQLICTESISHWVQKTGAKRGVAIVVKAGSGDILAIAQYPSIDPANYADCVENPFAYEDFACRCLYEPGSVCKPLTAAVGLSNGLLSPETTFFVDNPPIILDGYPIGEYHTIWESPGRHTLKEIIVRSSNIGMSRIGLALGEAVIRDAFEMFGFTTKPTLFIQKVPNAKFPGTDRPLSKVEIANLSFGQGLAVSPMALVLAFNVFASNGWYHVGRLVSGVKDSVSGKVRWLEPHPGWRAIEPEACMRMVDILHCATTDPKGTGRNAVPEGYLIAGKTGSAQVPLSNGKGYHQEEDQYYKVSFAGFGPLPEPKFTIAVVLEKPRGGHKYDSGGKAAAPCFRQIFEALMDLDSRRSAEEGSLLAVN